MSLSNYLLLYYSVSIPPAPVVVTTYTVPPPAPAPGPAHLSLVPAEHFTFPEAAAAEAVQLPGAEYEAVTEAGAAPVIDLLKYVPLFLVTTISMAASIVFGNFVG